MMLDSDISLINIELYKKVMGVNGTDFLNILEWGSGNSTLYFSDRLSDKWEQDFRWDTIEHDVKWYLHVQKFNKLSEVKCHLFQAENPQDKIQMREDRVEQYVNMPRCIGLKYDVIIVDGCQRNKCLDMAKRFLKEDGIVLLHDAERDCYEEGKEGYIGKYLSKTLWMGKLN